MRMLIPFTILLLVAAPMTTSAQTEQAPKEQTDASLPQVVPEPESPQESANGDVVARAQFTTDVVEHEPIDALQSLPGDLDRVYFFTEIVDMADATVTHRWMHDGEVVADVPISIGGPRWRAYSVKTMPATPEGTWTVQVIDDAGRILSETDLASQPAESQTMDGSEQSGR